MKNKLISLLSEASGLTSLASCVNDDGSLKLDELEKQFDAIRTGIEGKLTKAKEEATEAAAEANKGKTFEDGRTNGQSEATRKMEKRIREQFAIEDQTLSGDKLFEEVAARKEKPTKEITKDQVERLPWYQKLMEDKENAHKEELGKVKGEFDEHKTAVSKKERMSQMRAKAMPFIEELNLNFSADPQRKAAQIDLLFQKLEADDYDFQDDGKRILVLRDGKVLKDKLDNTIGFKEHITGTATTWFDPKESKERGSAGLKKEEGDGEKKEKKTWTREMPKSQAEFEKLIVDTSIPVAEREALMIAYPAQSTA
jgi:hypothetical protein